MMATGYYFIKGVVIMGRKVATAVVCLLLLVGLGFILYPTVSNYINELHSSKNVAGYLSETSGMSDEEIQQEFEKADAFNRSLLKSRNRWRLSDELFEEYNEVLDIDKSGIMSVLTIPKLNIKMSVYHGTSDTVLQVAAGHMEGSTLPIGTSGTHAVISGHTGLPQADLFTGIDKLEIGDMFMITTLNKKMAYRVCSINTVLPTEMEYLDIEDDKDLVTLLTCTPYGVNSHRLLITGERVPYEEEKSEVTNIENTIMTHEITAQEWFIIGAVAFVVLCLVYVLVSSIRHSKKKTKQNKGDF